MPVWTWVALGIFLALVVATLAFLVVRGVELYRRVRALEQSVGVPMEQLLAELEALNARAERASQRAEDVERRMADLRVSLDRLGVLGWALGDAGDALRRWRSLSGR
ncbi:MAG: hypothetical protein R3C15_04435 [Thermoleophilia bacterium]